MILRGGIPALLLAVVLAVAFSMPCRAETLPQELSVESNGRAVALTRYAAPGEAPRSAVLILHGVSGFDANREAYVGLALELARNGIDAYLVSYYAPGASRSCYCFDVWAATIADVTSAILRRPEARRVGLLGFSLGGGVAVTSAHDPRVAALVVFYGFNPNTARRARLPPLLVLHGDADDNVPLRDGQDLVEL